MQYRMQRSLWSAPLYKDNGTPVITCAKTHDGKIFERLDPQYVVRTLRDVGDCKLPPLLQVYVDEPLDPQEAQEAARQYDSSGLYGWSAVLYNNLGR